MIREYKNVKFYKNLRIANILSSIALGIAVILIVIDIFQFAIGALSIKLTFNEILGALKLKFAEQGEIFFYAFVWSVPQTVRGLRKTENKGETRFNNDYSKIMFIILWSLVPYYILLFSIFLSIIFGDYFHLHYWAYRCGYMFLSHIFVYVGDCFLIGNLKIIKEDWKSNPPEFIVLRKQAKNKAKSEQKSEQQKKTSNQLLEKSGFKFFIKYYEQIKNLPLRDVEIEENYSPAEREERLNAAKKIIDSNLTLIAINEIMANYKLTPEQQANAEMIIKTCKDTSTSVEP